MYSFNPYYYPYKSVSVSETKYDCNRVVSVEGVGSLTVKPDVVKITIGVVTTSDDAKVAQAENKEIMKDVINSIKDNGIRDEDIKTYIYYLRPEYQFTTEGKEFKGFEARQLVQINVRDIAKVDKIVDDAIESGANYQQGIDFIVSDYRKYYDEALDMAVSNSIDTAMKIANSQGMMISQQPVKLVEKSSALQQRGLRGGLLIISENDTVEKGTIDVVARVEADFMIM